MALKKIEIVSATPGRLQLTIPALKGKLHLSKRLDNTLSTLAGIEDVVIDDVFGSVLLRYDTDDIELYLFATGLGRALRIVLGKNGISDADVAELGASLARRHEAFWIRRLLLQRREAELETQKTERRLAARAGQAKAAKAKAEQQVADAEQAKLMAEEQLRTELLMRRQAEEEAETCKQARERAEVDLQEQIQSCHHAVESLEEAQRQVAHAEQARLIAESDLETERVARRQAEDHARTCQEAREQVEANLQKQTRILQQTMEAMEKAERQAAHADQDRALRERELESEKRIRRELENEVMVSRADCERAQATVQQLSETLRQTTDALTGKLETETCARKQAQEELVALHEDLERFKAALQQEMEAHQQTADALAAESQIRTEAQEMAEMHRTKLEHLKAKLLVCSRIRNPVLTRGFPD